MSGFQDLIAAGRVMTGIRLGSLTTYKLGGPARHYMELQDRADLPLLAAALAEDPQPVLVVGRGSNLVISDEGWPGLAIRFGFAFSQIGMGPEPECVVTAGSATTLPRLARETVSRGRSGLEFYVGIPGTVGGAIHTNAGGHGSETGEWVLQVELFDLETAEFQCVDAAALDFKYRSSSLGPTQLVVAVDFRTVPGEVERGQETLREITRWRRLHQPGGTLNAGSVFRNPEDDSAGRIIDELGLKGFQIGGARVSAKHANFFEAGPEATAQDVHDLVAEVQRRVFEKTGIALVPEVQFAGPFT